MAIVDASIAAVALGERAGTREAGQGTDSIACFGLFGFPGVLLRRWTVLGRLALRCGVPGQLVSQSLLFVRGQDAARLDVRKDALEQGVVPVP